MYRGNKLIYKVLFFLVIVFPVFVNAQRGCCSHHGGVAYCGSYGKYICNDGTASPTCTCTSSANSTTNSKSSSSSSNNRSKPTTTNRNNSNSNSTTKNKASESSTIVTPPKSNVSTLQSLAINNDNIPVSNEMSYETEADKANITYKTTDEKATVKIEQEETLKNGNNIVKIIVTAEDGVSKTEYKVNINKKTLSNDKSFTMKVNNEEVTFYGTESKKIYIDNDEKLKIEYKLNDPKSKMELNYDEEISTGDHQIKFSVIAEDNTTEEYTLNIRKKSNDDNDNINSVVGLAYLTGVGIAIYKANKHKKLLNKNKSNSNKF